MYSGPKGFSCPSARNSLTQRHVTPPVKEQLTDTTEENKGPLNTNKPL